VAPDHTNTHAALAGWYSIRIQQGWARDRLADAKALRDASHQALTLDPANPLALARLGDNHTILDRDYDKAIESFERTLETSPNNAAAWLWSSPTFACSGDGAEGVRRAERAIALMPRDAFLFRSYYFLSLAHFASGSYEEASRWGRMSYEANPNYTSNLRITAAALFALGKRVEALALARRSVTLEPDFRADALAERNPGRDPRYRHRYQEVMTTLGVPR
jgi:tetratricopeptide (TPR) repeat protein